MYRIELSEEQMKLISDCLEDISRFASGQYELENTINQMAKELPIHREDFIISKAKRHLLNAKKELFKELSAIGYKSYNSTAFIGNTYAVYRSIKYQLNKDNGISNVYSSPSLPSGNLGTIKIELLDGETIQNNSNSGSYIDVLKEEFK